MASLASAARDIPKASSSRDNLTAVAAWGDQATTVTRSRDLPTPPNSISPALPAHGLKAQLERHKLEPIDSDLDLQSIASSSGRRSSSPSLESAGAITSGMLAKYYLPDVLLNHGPLAIRHIMGYLTTSVPGFSCIPPTKARRVVVGALEGRGGEGGGPAGDVLFEKVGWGRWDARRKGQAARKRQSTPPSGPSSYTAGIPISRMGGSGQDRVKPRFAGSIGGESLVLSHDDRDVSSMLEHEADKMSMDGSASASCSEAPDDDVPMNDDPEDVTDDEDWAAVGAAALRAESYPHMAAARSGHDALSPNTYTTGGLRNFSASHYGMARPPQASFDFSAFAGPSDAQELEAVEALLRLGSV
ncbi:Protein STB3 [Escovopsis weberi]|uniref:Protein STB3 n=1 Tax=Escovopsis weberi TaxID=150374 RepID=A0A0M9VTG0_ESCWE|nr:Protein STB3 [Escovopsis weberi]